MISTKMSPKSLGHSAGVSLAPRIQSTKNEMVQGIYLGSSKAPCKTMRRVIWSHWKHGVFWCHAEGIYTATEVSTDCHVTRATSTCQAEHQWLG
jgi:hypothetical protein